MLRERIQHHTVRVAVIGCGYVGLPLAVSFARAGVHTTAIDLNADRVARIRRGESYIPDVPAEDLRRAVAEGRLAASADYAAIAEIDAAFICVPTPFTKMKAPDISYIEAAARGVAAHLRPGMLVVLQSTTYPGTTEEVVQPILEAAGLKAGRDFYLAFSPERIDPGNRQYGAHNTPKVVGGIDPESTALTAALFGLLIDPRHIHPVSGPKAAEMCKLLENIFRSVNIALVNELTLLCDRMKIDIWEVIGAAATKPFGFMPFYPGPGVGGHCIPVDPYYLSWKAREYDFYTKFVELAAEVNQAMPFYTVGKVVDGLNARGQALQGAKVLVLGAAFKRDIDDARNSPAVEVLKILWTKGARAAYHDPYVPELHLEQPFLHADPVPPVFRSVPLTEETLEVMDCVVIAVHHSCFDIPWVVKHSRLVVDAQNATRGLDGPGGQVVRL